MTAQTEDKFMNSIGAILGAVLVGVGISSWGFFLTSHDGQQMGSALFFVTPLFTGFALALLSRTRVELSLVLTLTFVVSMLLLFVYRLESALCVILSAPILLVSFGIGAWLGVLLRSKTRLFPYERSVRILVLLMLPLLLQGFNVVEEPALAFGRKETIVDSIEVRAKPEAAWEQLVSLDRITVPKPWLMNVGLYEPVGCETTYDGDRIERTCHFKEGDIYERVDVWKPASYMHLTVINSTLPGRPWLEYGDASYNLIGSGPTTKIVRTTTIWSRLSPAWYWQHFEKMGVSAEHQFVLAEIKKRVEVASQLR